MVKYEGIADHSGMGLHENFEVASCTIGKHFLVRIHAVARASGCFKPLSGWTSNLVLTVHVHGHVVTVPPL